MIGDSRNGRDRGPGTGRYDLAVVGAGIVGLAVAREFLRRRGGAKVIVIDKQDSVACHQTGHNSGVIHSGVYYKPGSLKARLCVQGARLLYEFCDEHAIRYERCGKLIVAVRDDELPRLADLEERGHANAVPGLRRVRGAEIAAIEPECRGLAALHSPATGIVDYGAVARALEQDLRGQGVTFALGCTISAVRRERGQTLLAHAGGAYRAGWSILCAGLWSDRLAVASGAPADPRIVPFRGAYLRLAAGQPAVVRGMVYPVPDPRYPFLGVHLTRDVDNGVHVGPNAVLALALEGYRWRDIGLRDLRDIGSWPGTWRLVRQHWRNGLAEMAGSLVKRRYLGNVRAYLPDMELGDLVRSTAGVRAQAIRRDGGLVDDFVLQSAGQVMLVRNAPSPAATSSLAIAEHIVSALNGKATAS